MEGGGCLQLTLSRMEVVSRSRESFIDSAPVGLPRTRRIEAKPGWRTVDLQELWEYRDLFYFLIRRDVKVRYVQSVLGMGWAIIQPFFMMIVFTIIFGKLVGVNSDGAPYAIFSFTALVPWTFFATALAGSADSMIVGSAMLTKVYFPRLIMPLATVLGKLVDFVIALILLFGLMAWFRITPTIWAPLLPFLALLMVLTAAGTGMWLTALAVQYRDVKYVISFALQIAMYASPVVYPASLIPDQYRLVYALNPMVGVIEGFRSALLETTPMPLYLIAVSTLVATGIVITGVLYFRRMERIFADVV